MFFYQRGSAATHLTLSLNFACVAALVWERGKGAHT